MSLSHTLPQKSHIAHCGDNNNNSCEKGFIWMKGLKIQDTKIFITNFRLT